MKLRNPHLAVVDRSTVVKYILNPTHPDNGGKARFFESLGFSAADPEPLISALRAVAHSGDVIESVKSLHGEKYVVDGTVSSQTEKQRSSVVRTVWIIDQGSDTPRLVTAYPGKE